MKKAWLVDTFIIFSIVVILTTMFKRYQPYGLAWVATPSVPMGLYLTKEFQPYEGLQRGEVLCWRHGELGKFLDRNYIPEQFRICKPVYGLPGDALRVTDTAVEVLSAEGTVVATAALTSADTKGRPMPNALKDLTAVPPQSLVVLAPEKPNALDSRYLGPIPLSAIQKRMTPLWLK